MPGVVGIINRTCGAGTIDCRDIAFNGFEQLRAATPTTRAEIIQIQPGRMQGRLRHASVAGLSLGFGTFSHGVVSRGVYSDDRVTIGFLTGADGLRARQSGAGGIRIWSPRVEHQSRYVAGVSFGAISILTDDMARFFGPDSLFSEPTVWLRKNAFYTTPEAGDASARILKSIMAGFARCAPRLGPSEAEYWKRAIIESACYAIANSEQSEIFVSSMQRLVKRAQDYLDGAGDAPVHISELTSHLRVSRRTLHRAFDEVVGIPPMRYLRQKRLCEARLLLQQTGATGITVAEVAFRQGFSDFSRFSAYYRALFGENPSETLNQHRFRS